jgi:hypothetical protein
MVEKVKNIIDSTLTRLVGSHRVDEVEAENTVNHIFGNLTPIYINAHWFVGTD